MQIYTFGDSNSSLWQQTPRPAEMVWPSRFGTRLVGDAASGNVVKNFAIGGTRVHFCKGQFAVPGVTWPAIETYAPQTVAAAVPKPDRAILCAGTNDILLEYMPDAEVPDFYAAFSQIDESLRDAGVTLYSIGVLPFRVTGMVSQVCWNQREPRRQATNQRLRTIFGPDRYLEPSCLQDSTGQLAVNMSWTDGLHISELAHDTLARAIPLAWGQ